MAAFSEAKAKVGRGRTTNLVSQNVCIYNKGSINDKKKNTEEAMFSITTE